MRLYTRIYLHLLGMLAVVAAVSLLVFATGFRNAYLRGLTERLVRHGAALVADRFQDPAARTRAVRRLHEELTLTAYEFELLRLLVANAGRVLSRDELLDRLKGEEYESFDRSIDVHVSKLRAKLEPNPKEPRYIKTVRGVGYVLAREGQEA